MTDSGNPLRAEDLELNEAEDGLVVYDPAHQMVHHLNPSAATVFELCDGSRDPDAIAQGVADAYGLEAPPSEDTIAALRQLAERNLIVWDA